jgi:branched-chain amino acid transport system ATP-binding protein
MSILEVSQISKKFGGLKALDDVSFSIADGQLKALIGPNGAGKSTLLNIISRFYSPDLGQAVYLDYNLLSYKAHQIAGLGIGRTFQMVQFLGEISVLKSVMVGAHCLSKCGIFKGMLKIPNERKEEEKILDLSLKALSKIGIENLADKRMNVLTYADQKKVELAKALVGRPKLLLLDEPAGGLNNYETEELKDILRRINSMDVTILIIEHNMPLVMSLVDEIVVLDYGKKIAEGNPDEICSNKLVIDAYLGKDI